LENIEGIYRYLGISRTNNVWSWGVATEEFVILQVWKDEKIKESKPSTSSKITKPRTKKITLAMDYLSE
jgi:hypothetical protein